MRMKRGWVGWVVGLAGWMSGIRVKLYIMDEGGRERVAFVLVVEFRNIHTYKHADNTFHHTVLILFNSDAKGVYCSHEPQSHTVVFEWYNSGVGI